MIDAGMPVMSRDGEHVGYVVRLIGDGSAFPPGLVVTMSRLFGLRRRLVPLTTFDVRDVRGGIVILRISRWDANNRCDRTPNLGARVAGAQLPRFA